MRVNRRLRNAALGSAALLISACGSGQPDSGGAAADGEPAPAAVVVTPEMVARGGEIYKLNCAPCHGASGRGDGPSSANLDPKPRDHTNGEYMKTLSDEDIAKTVQLGGGIKNMPQMPSSPHIRGDDMTALVAFIRSLSMAAHGNASAAAH